MVRLAWLRSGGVDAAAARAAGVKRSTFAGWLKAGRLDLAEGREGTPHARLVETIDAARDELIGELAGHHLANALHSRDNLAIAAILRRLDPEEFGERCACQTAPDSSRNPPPLPTIIHMNYGDDLREATWMSGAR